MDVWWVTACTPAAEMARQVSRECENARVHATNNVAGPSRPSRRRRRGVRERSHCTRDGGRRARFRGQVTATLLHHHHHRCRRLRLLLLRPLLLLLDATVGCPPRQFGIDRFRRARTQRCAARVGAWQRITVAWCVRPRRGRSQGASGPPSTRTHGRCPACAARGAPLGGRLLHDERRGGGGPRQSRDGARPLLPTTHARRRRR